MNAQFAFCLLRPSTLNLRTLRGFAAFLAMLALDLGHCVPFEGFKAFLHFQFRTLIRSGSTKNLIEWKTFSCGVRCTDGILCGT